MLDFLTPQVFDLLVLVIVAVGGAFAVRRLVRDFRSPPRFAEDKTEADPKNPETT